MENKKLKPKPISNVQEFLSNLLQLSVHVATPTVEGIDGEWIESEDDPSAGFALLYVPESQLPPHRVLLNLKDVKDHYYFRTGESFVVASHTQLEDMFGRRPKPRLKLKRTVKSLSGSDLRKTIDIILGIENTGRGVAKLPFFAIRIHKPYSKKDIVKVELGLRQIRTSGSSWLKYGIFSDSAIHPKVTLEVAIVRIKVRLDSPQAEVKPLKIEYQIAAEGLPLIESEMIIPGLEIWQAAKSD